jgi:RHS repeat-associated protein
MTRFHSSLRLCIAITLLTLAWQKISLAQIAPTGGHYAGRSSDTGFEPGAINTSGGYTASVPLDLPAARGSVPVPLQIISGARRVGAAGLGWDIPLSYVRRDSTYQHRRPAIGDDTPPQGRERVFASLQGRILDLVPKGADWVPRHDAPKLVFHEQNGTWVLFDGRGFTWTFTAPSVLSDTGLWLLSSVGGPDGNTVQIDYEIGTPALPGVVPVQGVSIDLVHISYNTHPTLGCPKNEISLTYRTDESSPLLSMSVLGDRTLARTRILKRIDVLSRAICGGGPTGRPHRLRSYLFSYDPGGDADTRQPRLIGVQMSGREGTPEGQDDNAVPIAAYAYGSASHDGKLKYQVTQPFQLPSVADSKMISSTESGAVNAPGCCVGYNTWQSLTDVTGDGRPDLVFQNVRDGKLWVARNVPGADGSTTFGPISQLHDATFTNGAFEVRTSQAARFGYQVQLGNIDEVWRKAIDINGDGRLDIIDAGEEPGYWVVYLNTPDDGPSGVKWVRRRVSIATLYNHLAGKGHLFDDSNYVPLSRRFSGRAFTRGPGGPIDVSDEVTVTEWDLIDLNGDGYPDFVYNGYRTNFVQWGTDINNNPHYAILPVSPPPHSILAVINLRGVLFDDRNYLFSAPITVEGEGECGVRKWVDAGYGSQNAVCDIADVNGDGLVDRIENGYDVFLGTGHSFSAVKLTLPGPPSWQISGQRHECTPSAPPNTTFNVSQVGVLRDLTGDGIPDYVEFNYPHAWRVSIGTGTGFAPPIDVEVLGGGFSLSFGVETCNGGSSRTTEGLYDINGDGKPDVVTLLGDVFQLAGTVPGKPEAGRLIQIDNGYGAVTNITYRSAKEDATTPHQVPFPEIVVSSVQTADMLGLGGTLAATRYAYGNAEMIFDSALDAFTLPAYGRSVELRVIPGQGDEIDGLATITDTYGLDPFIPKASESCSRPDSNCEHFGRYLRAGRVRDRTVLKNIGTDPWTLLVIDITTDSRRIAATHNDSTPRLFEEPAVQGADPMDCIDMMFPYDFRMSFGYNLGGGSYNVCSAHGFLYVSATDSWRGDAAPPSASNVATRSQIVEIDDYGRVTSVWHENDHFRGDDDICIETHYAVPTGQNAPLLSAPQSRRVWDCNREGTRSLAVEYFEYDNLPSGQVSRGHVTSHVVERRATDDGSWLGTLRAFDVTYDAAGNPWTIKNQREDGAVRTLTMEYDPFGIANVRMKVDATGMQPRESQIGRDLLSLELLTITDANLTQRGVDRDGFGRVVRSTFTPPGGALGVLSTISYLGFLNVDPLGRRVVTTIFGDAVLPGNLDTAIGRTTTVYLDELGRARRTELALGQDYANQTLITGMRKYDLLGRVRFQADPFPTNQDPTTAYGTTFFFNIDGTPSCFIRGTGQQLYSQITDETSERYPTCFTRSFANHEEWLAARDSASLLPTSPQAGVTTVATRSAIGRELTRFTSTIFTRLEYAAFTYDRLGQPIGMTRYGDPVLLNDPVHASRRLDSLGQVLEWSEPETATKYFKYSNWGELLEVRWTDSAASIDRRLVSHYDALGRMTYREERNNGVADPDTINEYFYDVGTSVAPQVTPTNVLGRLAQATAPTGKVYFSYDPFGRVNAQTFTDTNANVYVEKSTFRGDGALSLLEFYLPDTGFNRELVEYGYDTATRLRVIKFSDGSIGAKLYEAREIDPFGRVRKAVFGGATHYQADYADAGRRLTKEVSVASTPGSRRIYYLGYDPLGREMSRREIKDGAATGPETNVAYDRLGRLSSAVKTDGATTLSNWHYSYDALGNLLWLKDLVDPSRETAMSFGPGDQDRVCRINYASETGTACNVHYDGVGNIIDQHTRTGQRGFKYFGSGRVSTIVEGAAHATFRYDPFGAVQELNVSGAGVSDARHDRRYGHLIERRDEEVNGTTTTFISRNIPGPSGVVASRRGTENEWVFGFGEQRGSRFFTDSNGAFVQDIDYEPYGEAKSSGVQPGSAQYSNAQWNGGDALAAFRLSHLGARLYDPVIGRFLSRDWLVLPRTAATTNAYAFAMNDPLNRSDPSGMQCIGPECQGQGPTNPDPGGGGPSGTNPPCLYLPPCAPGAPGAPSNPRAANRPPPDVSVVGAPQDARAGEAPRQGEAEEGGKGEDLEKVQKGFELVDVGFDIAEHFTEEESEGWATAFVGGAMSKIGVMAVSIAQCIRSPSLGCFARAGYNYFKMRNPQYGIPLTLLETAGAFKPIDISPSGMRAKQYQMEIRLQREQEIDVSNQRLKVKIQNLEDMVQLLREMTQDADQLCYLPSVCSLDDPLAPPYEVPPVAAPDPSPPGQLSPEMVEYIKSQGLARTFGLEP